MSTKSCDPAALRRAFWMLSFATTHWTWSRSKRSQRGTARTPAEMFESRLAGADLLRAGPAGEVQRLPLRLLSAKCYAGHRPTLMPWCATSSRASIRKSEQGMGLGSTLTGLWQSVLTARQRLSGFSSVFPKASNAAELEGRLRLVEEHWARVLARYEHDAPAKNNADYSVPTLVKVCWDEQKATWKECQPAPIEY